MDSDYTKRAEGRSVLLEFVKYSIIGGIAFIIDFLVLFVFRELVFSGSSNPILAAISVAAGFIVSFLFNYIMSILFVFKVNVENDQNKHKKLLPSFLVIAVIGLILTEILMYVGEFILLFHYLLVKAVVAGIVLIWNYVARKKVIKVMGLD